MKFRNAFAAIAAAALVASPTLAAGSDSAARAVMPAPETVDANGQQEIYGASVLLQLAVVVAVGVGIWLIYHAVKGKDKPASP